jgi:hypothetical protein
MLRSTREATACIQDDQHLKSWLHGSQMHANKPRD